MSFIVKRDTNGVKPLLQTGEFGYDNYPAGGDNGRVYVGTGSENIPLAKKAELNAKANKTDADLLGIPKAPTAAVGTNSTQLATTAFVGAEIADKAYSKTQLDAGQLDNRYYTETEIDDILDSTVVKLTGDQTIEDVKTFSSSPIIPTPTTNFQAATKKYVDDAIAIDSIDDLATYVGLGTVIVKDINRGGIFVSKTGADIDPNTGNLYVVNSGTVFAKLGGGFWVRQYSGAVNVKWFGVKGDFDGTTGTDDTANIQNAINSLNNVDLYFPRGLYLINPSISIFLKEGINIVGEGRLNTQFVLSKIGGTAFKREWNTSAPNEYLNSITIKDIGIIFQHIIPANPANYRQIALDLRYITRSSYENIYIGNYPIGLSAELGMIQPAIQVDARQGYGVLLSSTSSTDIAYSGGEVNILENIFCSGVRKGIIIDGSEFYNPGYRSASYINKVQNCEVSIAEIGLIQEGQDGAKNFISNIIVQSIGNMRGSSDPTYCIYIAGYENTIIGGYGENAGNVVFSATSKRNKIVMFNGSNSIIDNGLWNVIENNEASNKWNFNINKQKNSYKSFCRAYVSFYWNGSSIVIDDIYNIQNVARAGIGDYNIMFTTGVMENSNWCISANGVPNVSANPMNITLRTATTSTARIVTYNLNTSAYLDPQSIRVAFFGGLN